jgi:ABC-type branched-subunit amino acid transport system substrate-binding protein
VLIDGYDYRRNGQSWSNTPRLRRLLGRKVELKMYDDASNQDTVVADYTKLITQDPVDLLLGTFSSLLNFAASVIAERHNMVYVEPAADWLAASLRS